MSFTVWTENRLISPWFRVRPFSYFYLKKRWIEENVRWVQGKLGVNQSQIRRGWVRFQEKPHFPNWSAHNAICWPLNLIYGHKCRRTSVTASKREKYMKKILKQQWNIWRHSNLALHLFWLDSVYSFIIAKWNWFIERERLAKRVLILRAVFCFFLRWGDEITPS